MPSNEIRCKRCKVLLATEDGEKLTVRRGRMHVTTTHSSSVVIGCYRCGTTNICALPISKTPNGTDDG